MADTTKDDVFEITDKNFQKVAGILEKSGYSDGITDGQNSIFQQSFDNGYEDGFRIGFLLGKAHKEKSSRGNCSICADPALLQKTETEAREIHRKRFEEEEETST